MGARIGRRIGATLMACAGLALPAWAATTDDDALSLQPDEASPEAARAAETGSKLFVEGAIGWGDQRYDKGSRAIARAAVDVRTTLRPGAGTRAVLSARVDASDPSDPRVDGAVFSFREAYVGWQNDAATHVLELGRINLREGPGYGYNPTDFFRDNALRTISTENPFSLRENRIGSVMLRAQQLWSGGSIAAVYSPELDDGGRSARGFSVDMGATNARHRGSLSLGTRWSERISTQLIAYKEAGASLRVGANATALVTPAAVVHGEWSYGREPDLLASAFQLPGDGERRHRAVGGVTYTTPVNLSLTVEYQYNGFALGRNGWRDLGSAGGIGAQAAYFTQALARQDSASRNAVLLFATQRDIGIKKLDLTALVRFNRADRSELFWLDLRYRLDKFDLALQLQRNGGSAGSEFGITTIRTSASVLGVLYF